MPRSLYLPGIGPNGEVHILSYKQTQFIEQALVVHRTTSDDFEILEPPQGAIIVPPEKPGDVTGIRPIPIMWPTTLICRFPPLGQVLVPRFASRTIPDKIALLQ